MRAIIALALVLTVGAASAQDLTAEDRAALDQAPASGIYRGPVKLPDFRGRDRAHANYRTRIREGLKEGPNFAGHLALIMIGCGLGCRLVTMVDVRTGHVLDFPLSGLPYWSLALTHRLESRRVLAQWVADARCRREDLTWNGKTVARGTVRDLGEAEACYQTQD